MPYLSLSVFLYIFFHLQSVLGANCPLSSKGKYWQDSIIKKCGMSTPSTADEAPSTLCTEDCTEAVYKYNGQYRPSGKECTKYSALEKSTCDKDLGTKCSISFSVLGKKFDEVCTLWHDSQSTCHGDPATCKCNDKYCKKGSGCVEDPIVALQKTELEAQAYHTKESIKWSNSVYNCKTVQMKCCPGKSLDSPECSTQEWCSGENKCISPGDRCLPMTAIIISATVGGFVLILIIIVICVVRRNNRKSNTGVSGETLDNDDEFLAYKIKGRFG